MSETYFEPGDNHIDDELEAKIQDEIRRRILEKAQTTGGDEPEGSQTQATLEALEELTGIPREESQKIALEVRDEYTREYNRRLAKRRLLRKTIYSGMLLIIALGLIIGGLQYKTHRKYANISYKAVFTTGLNENDEPVDTLSGISLHEDRVYLFISWQFLPRGEYQARTRIFDGSGSLLWSYTLDFFTDTGTYNTWFWYSPREKLDAPGQWKFEIYLDGRKFGEKFLAVKAEL